MAGYIGTQPVPQATQHRESFTATASQTSFATSGYTPNFVDVYLNGVHLLNGTDYTATNGSDIVLTTGAAAGDVLEVISYSTFEVNSQSFTGTTTTEALTVTGDFTSAGIDDNASSTAVTIDSSGNLLVGNTTDRTGASSGAGGTVIGGAAGTYLGAARNSATVQYLNRIGTDGAIAEFRKDGTTVGSIGSLYTTTSRFFIAGEGLTAGILFGSNQVDPMRNGALIDNSVDLGESSYRYDDVYATNGTIQTSDRNEKQQIAELTVAEITAAKAISKLFKTFKWNSSVEEKGEAARIHSGVIAQDVEQAMTDAGLDAGKYAFFISSTWWELDGQTYGTAEEAPEGAVEKNRKGIRYPQLLSFVGAATEQRLASIESRLDALEGN